MSTLDEMRSIFITFFCVLPLVKKSLNFGLTLSSVTISATSLLPISWVSLTNWLSRFYFGLVWVQCHYGSHLAGIKSVIRSSLDLECQKATEVQVLIPQPGICRNPSKLKASPSRWFEYWQEWILYSKYRKKTMRNWVKWLCA